MTNTMWHLQAKEYPFIIPHSRTIVLLVYFVKKNLPGFIAFSGADFVKLPCEFSLYCADDSGIIHPSNIQHKTDIRW